jgi:hypothetical protein
MIKNISSWYVEKGDQMRRCNPRTTEYPGCILHSSKNCVACCLDSVVAHYLFAAVAAAALESVGLVAKNE